MLPSLYTVEHIPLALDERLLFSFSFFSTISLYDKTRSLLLPKGYFSRSDGDTSAIAVNRRLKDTRDSWCLLRHRMKKRGGGHMKRLRTYVIVLLLGCCIPLLIWTGAGIAFYQRRKNKNLLSKALPNSACSVDAD